MSRMIWRWRLLGGGGLPAWLVTLLLAGLTGNWSVGFSSRLSAACSVARFPVPQEAESAQDVGAATGRDEQGEQTRRPEDGADLLAAVDVPQPGALLAEVTGHPAVERLMELEAVGEFLRSPQYLQFRLGLALVEGQAGSGWEELVAGLAGRGAHLRVRRDGQSGFVVFRGGDEALLRRTLGNLLQFVSGQARNAGQAAPFETREADGIRLAVFPEFALGRLGSDWGVARTEDEICAALRGLAGQVGGESEGESGGAMFWPPAAGGFGTAADANRSPSEGADLRAWVNLDAVRASGLAGQLVSGMADNPATELLVGGVLEALRDAAWATAEVGLTRERLEVSLATGFDPERVGDPRRYFFGDRGLAAAPRWISPTGMLGSLSAWRDLSGWWLAKEHLFDRNTVAQLVQADSQVSTLFSGLDFGGEVLGALEPGLQLLVVQQDFSKGVAPAVRLPAFAVVGRLRDPAAMGRRFKVAFQSVMGFANLGLAQQGQPQFDVNTATTPGGCICTSRVFPEADAPRDLFVFNFSPTLVIDGPWLVLASTEELAGQLVGMATAGAGETGSNGDGEVAPTGRVENTVLRVDLSQLASVLRDNREGLIANNMLEQGNNRAQATREVGLALDVLDLLRELDVRLEGCPGELRLVTGLRFSTGAGETP